MRITAPNLPEAKMTAESPIRRRATNLSLEEDLVEVRRLGISYRARRRGLRRAVTEEAKQRWQKRMPRASAR